MDDLAVSVAAVLVAEACNVGLRPVAMPSVPALTHARLSHVDQNYVHVETIGAANVGLIEAQAKVPFAEALGGGLVASVVGLRFVVPVATLNAAPNPHYFGMRRGVPMAQRRERPVRRHRRDRGPWHGARLALHLGPALEPRRRPAPRGRHHRHGVLHRHGLRAVRDPGLPVLASHKGHQRHQVLADRCPHRLRRPRRPGRSRRQPRTGARVLGGHAPGGGVALDGAVRAYDLMRMFSRDGHPFGLGRAFAEYGRIAKTVHLLSFIDVDDSYRRRTSRQLTISEGRHQLGRKIFHGQRGQLRQAYREGQEDQLGALGLVLNAVVLWNTV